MAEAVGADNVEIAEQDQDWAGRATATIVGYVDTVRGASTGKALVASRVAVYGLAAGLVVATMAILLLILLVRATSSALNALLGIGGFLDLDTGTVWPTYLLLAVVFLGLGLWLWRKKDK